MNAYDPEAWLEFGVAMAGASAVLAGLIFVSVSINLEKVLEVRGLPGRAGESILMLGGILLSSTFLVAPGQSASALGIELIATGAVVGTALLRVILPAVAQPTRQPFSWRVTRVVAAGATSIPIVVAGASLVAEQGGGLYWLLAATALAFIAAIANAWVLLVEVVRDERYRPLEDNQSGTS